MLRISHVAFPPPQFGRSSLHFASSKERVEMVGLLIDRGADVKVKDKVNNAPQCLEVVVLQSTRTNDGSSYYHHDHDHHRS